MFDLPLMMSICMLAMAHGSNEINVAAPLTAEIFLLDSGDLKVKKSQEFIAIAVGIVSVMIGSFLLGQRLIYKHKTKFLGATSMNGIIANTSCAIMLYLASLANFTISGTYILMPTLVLLRKRDMNKSLNKLKSIKVVIATVFVTLFSMFLSVIMSIFFLYLDYNGPMSYLNNAFHQKNQTDLAP
mmetsp:Transcript_45185/g.59929  ORF Transcript_45185/g.59929 Transcript_45185/m.59929 type:complete len:185 (+) Transcript_45185:1506-2060(+)